MPFSRAKLSKIVHRVVSDIETRLDNGASRIRGRVENVLAWVVAGVSHSLHGHLEHIARQVVWDRCSSEYLARWAAIFGVYKNPAVKATGHTILVTSVVGTTIPQGTVWQRADGVQYVAVATVVTQASSENVAIDAVLPGAAANCPLGTFASLTAPIAGLDSQGGLSKVDSGIDEETDLAFRFRFLARLRKPPSGGGPGDYQRWALAANVGATRVWEGGKVPKVGWVTVWAVNDRVFGIALTAGQEADLLAYLETVAPLHMQEKMVVETPDRVALLVEVAISPNTAELQEAVAASIDEEVRARTEPGGVFRIGWVHAAIGRVPGLKYHVLSLPLTDTTNAAGEITTFDPDNDVTFLP